MLLFDILIIVLLVWALISGFRAGVLVELGGLAGLLVGIWLAFRFGRTVGDWFGDPGQLWVRVAGFALVLVAVIVAVALLSRVLRGVTRMAGLGALDMIGGAVISLLKMGIIAILLVYCFDAINTKTQWADSRKLSQSRLYGWMVGAAENVFPYFKTMKDMLVPGEPYFKERDPAGEQPEQEIETV